MALAEKVMAIGAKLVPEGMKQSTWLRPKYPLLGIELREDAVIAVRVAAARTGFRLAGFGRKALPEGVFSASLMNPGVGDPAVLGSAITEAMRQAGAERINRVSVAVPDTAIRVFMVDLSELPPTRAQAEEMIRFRIRKSVPFRPEESRLTWHVLGHGDDGRIQVLVAIAPDRAMHPIEDVMASIGLRCGLIDVASFDVYNALRLDGVLREAAEAAAPGGDTALINATEAYFSMLILRGDRLIFYRSKSYHVQGGYQGEESLRVVGRELRSTLGYYEEHLQGTGIGTVFLRVAGIDPKGLVEVVEAAGCGQVRRATVGNALRDAQHLPPETAVELLPAIGLALRRMA